MGDQQGSKAMTIYIVACFVLAMGALVAYKQFNDARSESASDYVKLAEQFADISAAYSRNLQKYYIMVESGQLTPVKREQRDKTDVLLRQVALKMGIKDGTGKDDHLDIGTPDPREDKRNNYVEYTVTVTLKNVIQSEWTTFLYNARNATFQYAHISELDVQRENTRFDRISIVKDVGSDRALWTVEITFMWFEKLDTGESDA